MSEKIGGEHVPDSTRALDVDGDIDLMVDDLDFGTPISRRFRRLPSDCEECGYRPYRPSGCGKSTLLRTINRMNDLIPICRYEGTITKGDVEITAKMPISLRYGRTLEWSSNGQSLSKINL